jgi:hypothetical protein
MKASGSLSTLYNVTTDPHSVEALTRLQKQLTAKGLRLSVTPNIPTPKQIDEAALQVWLNRFNTPTLKEVAEIVVRQYVTQLKFNDLLSSLSRGIGIINTLIPDTPYSVIVERGHSTEWVTELALQHLTALPHHLVEIGDNFRIKSSQLRGQRTFLILDDCAYSGEQLATSVLPNLYESLVKSEASEPCQLIVFVAFMTQYAEERVLKMQGKLQGENAGKVEVNFKLIVGSRVKTIAELEIDESIKPEVLQVLGANNAEVLKRFVLTWADWKKPDYMSFPPLIANAVVDYTVDRYTGQRKVDLPTEIRNPKAFIPDFDPPYKPTGKDHLGATHFSLK